MVKKYLAVLGFSFILLTSCSTLQNQEAANKDVKRILKSLKAARKEVKALGPELVAEIKRGEKETASVNDKLAYIEKEVLNIKVNQANQLRDSGGFGEALEQISSKLEEYNYRVSTVTQRLESIDSRISQLSDVYKSVDEREVGNSSEERTLRRRNMARWANMGDSILAIQTDLAELKTFLDAVRSNTGNRDKKRSVKLPPFKASPNPSGGSKAAIKLARPEAKKESTGRAKKKPSRIVSIAPDQLYKTAYKDYLKGHFGLAISEFKEYLKKYPNTEASANALYWLGESHFAEKSYSLSIDAFSRLEKRYPKSIKMPSAMLKTAYGYIELNESKKAGEVFESLIREFPSSGESELAKDALAKLKK